MQLGSIAIMMEQDSLAIEDISAHRVPEIKSHANLENISRIRSKLFVLLVQLANTAKA